MAGARKERRARGSGDSGDTPSGERAGNDGAGAVASSMDWETPEVLAAMNDADFARAVQRAVASHRKIFVHQERNWAAVRLRANLRTTRVAAERARQGLGASGRARARAKLALAAPESLPSRDAPPAVASVVVRYKKLRKGKAARGEKRGETGAPAETRQAAPLEALPRAENVPRYTSYQYCADTNAHMHDEVRRRLLYADQEGEMRAASDDDDDGEEDDGEDDESDESDEETTPGKRSPTAGRSQGAKSPARVSQETKKPRMTAAMRAAEKRRKAEETAAELAALEETNWSPREDYMLFALATTLGERSRVLDAIAETMQTSATKLRARLKQLKGRGGVAAAEKSDDAEKAKRPPETLETLEETYARALDAVRSGATAHAEFRAAAARVAARASAGRVGGGDAGAVPAEEAPAALGMVTVPKRDPEDFDADLDDGRDAPGTETGTDRPSSLAVARKHAASALARERSATWSLTAWRFLVRSGDALERLPEAEGSGPAARAREAPRRAGVIFDDENVEEGLDSFRTLFCARCHVYDCNLHGSGQMERGASRAYEPPVPERGPGGRPKAPKERDARAAAKETDGDARTNAAGGATRGAPTPCSRSCWLRAADRALPLHDPHAARCDAEAYVAAQALLPDAYALWSREMREWYDAFLDDASASANGGVEWSAFETSAFEKLREAFASAEAGGARVDPCALARAIDGPSCRSVHARLTYRDRVARVRAARGEAAEAREASDKKKGHGKKRKKSMYGKTQSAKKKSARRAIPDAQYRPCECCSNPGDGDESGVSEKRAACGADCSCSAVGNFCEKWCSCGGKCDNAFKGCSCKQGACNTRACPCFAANRECDPDICKRCSHTAEAFAHARRDGWPFEDLCMPVPAAPAAPTEFSRARVKPNEPCGNMRVLLSQRKHVQLGLSRVAGWGAFLRDGAARNELIGEYTGELITHKEADRRGKVYDKHSLISFLFNLNDYYVLDGHLRGNKLKFANHSSTPNCFARVLMVRGDHRVGIFALRDIEPGAELFFDYCYERDKAPDWVEFDDLPGTSAAKKNKPNANAMKVRA